MSTALTIVLLGFVFFCWKKTRSHPSRNWEQSWGGGVLWFEAVLGGASAQRLHDGREENLFQDLRCRAKQQDSVVGAALFYGLPCFQDWYYDGVLPNCRGVDSGNWEVKELRQEGQPVLPQMAEVENSEPIRRQGGGGARLPFAAATPISSNGLYECPLGGGGRIVTLVNHSVPHRVPNGDILPNNAMAEVLAVEANLRERALTLLMFISPRRRPASWF